MKKTILTSTVFLLFSSLLSFAQTDTSDINLGDEMTKMLTAKIFMDVDTNLYKTRQGNFYISEKPQAMIMAILFPQSLEKAKAKLSEDAKNKNMVIKESGELESNGKKIAFKTGEMKQNGEKMLVEFYAVEATKESTIFITGVYLPKDKHQFGNSAKKAALTAKLE